MPASISKPQKTKLALWVAAGGTVAAWCDKHGVLRRTGYAWSSKDAFRRLVAEYRQSVVDRAIGKMTKELRESVKTVVRLMKEGKSESIKLSAARILMEKLIDVQRHYEQTVKIERLNERLDVVESRQRDQAGRQF